MDKHTVTVTSPATTESAPVLVSSVEDAGPLKAETVGINKLVIASDTDTTSQTARDSSDESDDADEVKVEEKAAAIKPCLPPRRRSSIKLSTLNEDIPIKLGKKSFRMLPEVDVQQVKMDKVHRGASLPMDLNDPAAIFALMSGGYSQDQVAEGSAPLENAPKKVNMNVGFQNVQVRSYRQTVSDNPSVRLGVPVGLDWDFEEQQDVNLDDYEEERGQPRNLRQIYLPYLERMRRLEAEDPEDINAAIKNAKSDRFKRSITKFFLPVQSLEDAAESTTRKTKRIFGRKGKAKKEPATKESPNKEPTKNDLPTKEPVKQPTNFNKKEHAVFKEEERANFANFLKREEPADSDNDDGECLA